VSRARINLQARVDLLEIWHYIANDSPQNASKVWEEIKSAIWMLADDPGMGHERKDVKDPRLLFWPVGSYVIAYFRDTKPIEIARVVHGHRDFRKLFKKPSRRWRPPPR
jgi:toxin ParE1/3/4